MKKKIIALTLIIICIITLLILTNTSFAASTNLNPTASINVNRELIRNSSLTPLNNGYMRVYYDKPGNYIGIEHYDTSFNVFKKNKIDLELPIYGGFYAGSDAYYLVEGQNNLDENNDLEVIRVIKYDTNWNRLGAAAITSVPSTFGMQVRYTFDVGNVEFAEVDNKLYIVTGHQGYVDSTIGQGHQGFLMIEVDKDALTGKIVKADLYHSFAQYIDQTDSNIYVLEQSEGGRCTMLSQYSKSNLRKTSIKVFKYGGTRTTSWAVPCYASVNGIAISQNNILGIGTSIDQSQYATVSSTNSHNIYLTITPINNFSESATQTKWLTNYENDGKCFTGLELTKINDNRFLVTWEEASEEYGELDMIDNDTLSICKLHYMFIDGNGEKLSEEYTANASMSDCKPIVKNGKVIYYASNGNMVDFYFIDSSTGNFEKIMYRVAGDNITWDLDENGVLRFTGEGEMNVDTSIMLKDEISYVKRVVSSYYDSDTSWKAIRTLVKKIIVGENITSIDNNEFIGFSSLSEVILPESLEKIESHSFEGYRNFRTVYIPDNVKEIGEKAFFSSYYNNNGDCYFIDVYTKKGSYADSWASALYCAEVHYVEDLDLTDSTSKVNLKTIGESSVKLKVENITESNNDYKHMKNKVSDKTVLASYSISTSSGRCFGNNALTFSLGKNFNGKTISVVQKKQDGTISIQEIQVDSNGNVTLNTDELSSFMLAIDPNDMPLLLGDVNGDGKVNITDVALINAHAKKTKLLTGDELARADINGDGRVNITDVALVNAHVKKVKLLF